MTVYWVVWDGAAAWVVDRLDRENALPAVRRLRAAGSRAAATPPRPNCQTPPSLATLFTGSPSHEHGVTGFAVPGGGSVSALRPGFAPEFPRCPPVWRTLAEHGLRSAFVHTPWVFRADDGVGAEVDAAIEAYSGRRASHDVRPLDGERAWPVGAVEVGVRATATGAELHAGGERYELTGHAWTPVRLPDGTGFHARALTTDRGRLLLRTGVCRVRTAGGNRQLVAELDRVPLFAGEAIGSRYRAGWLGPRIAEGGDGSAEQILLSSVALMVHHFAAATDAVLGGHRADLVVVYLPWIDDLGHELLGFCDELSTAYRRDIAPAVWPYLRLAYQHADHVLGRVLDRAGPADTVLLGADHGMVGTTHLVAVNEQLIRAGLAVRSGDGGLEPHRCAVIYHPANNGSMWVNHTGYAGGVVPAAGVADVMRAAFAAVREIAEGASFLDERGTPVAAGDAGAVAYLALPDDLQPTADVDGGPVVRPTGKSGGHLVNTGCSRLRATFAAAGPGIAAGADLGTVENTIGARLVLRQLRVGGAWSG